MRMAKNLKTITSNAGGKGYFEGNVNLWSGPSIGTVLATMGSMRFFLFPESTVEVSVVDL